jgi:uncharacterized protein with HEPN domain
MRNRVIHGYFAIIDYRIVWNIVKIDIPSLKKEIELMLQKGVEDD